MTSAEPTIVTDQAVTLSVVVPMDIRLHAPSTVELLHRYHDCLTKAGAAHEFIVVVDGSAPDLSAALRALALDSTPLTILSFNRSFGESAAISVGCENARADTVLILPAFEQVSVSEIPKILEALEDCDMAVARRSGSDQTRSHGFRRRLLHGTLNMLVANPFTDLECDVRAFHRSVAEDTRVQRDQHLYLPLLAHAGGFRVRQIDVAPGREAAHPHGTYGAKVYLDKGFDLLSLFFLIRFAYKPLRFFGGVGLLLFFLGSVIVGYVVYERLFAGVALADRPALILGALAQMLGFQMIAIGFIGEILNFVHARDTVKYRVEKTINE
jgi:glycosyltransferase involved in cell wall biosynthesis